MQLVVMKILGEQEIGNEVHPNTTQFIKVVGGTGIAIVDGVMSDLHPGMSVMVPPGSSHNIINMNNTTSLKLYTVYSPPEHAPDLVQIVKPLRD